jgi:hypothetical protein
MADGLVGLTGIVGRLATNLDHFAAEHDRQLREAREQLEAADADLRSHIRDVESHLDVVIEMFERHLREDHGSRPS